MIAIGSNSNYVYIWDYEYAKILFEIQLPKETIEPTALSFINGQGLLIITATDGKLYIFKLRRPFSAEQQNKV